MQISDDQKGTSSQVIRSFCVLGRSTLSLGKYKKLSPRYCGPYKVIKKIREEAYKLKLPTHLKVHDVFHVNLLKPYILDPTHVLDDEQIVMPT